ncbi:MAG: NUDIX domain-containing protein [Geodermatophilaceae bacterium]
MTRAGVPAAPPRPWRLSARLLLVDADERILLVPVTDDGLSWWDLPGGGVEPGETTVEAAVRETLEETGYAVPAALVGVPCWTGEVVFRWLGAWHWSRQVVHLARVRVLPEPVALMLTEEEIATHGRACWYSVPEIVSQRLVVAPFHDPVVWTRLLQGEPVDGGLVRWSAARPS